MLNPLPSLLSLGFFAPTILRIVLGLLFVVFGINKLTKQKTEKSKFFEKMGLRPGYIFTAVFGAIELAAGVLLIIGLYTQIAAITAAVISFGAFYTKSRQIELLPESKSYYFILFAISVSLALTGAGALAFDLPL